MIEEFELWALGKCLDKINKLSSRELKIAALRCFCRGLRGIPNDEGDVLMLQVADARERKE